MSTQSRIVFQVVVSLAEACAIDELCIALNEARQTVLQGIIRDGILDRLIDHPKIYEAFTNATKPRIKRSRRGKTYRFFPPDEAATVEKKARKR